MAIDINALKANWSKKSAGEGTSNTGFWDKFYPFYKMNFDETATFRFLPDADADNPLGFIVENIYHELTINGKKKKVACMRMYGESSCPCCEASKKYYDAGDEKLGKQFWKKVDYVAQGVIVHSPFEYEVKADENPVRLISIGKKLYTAIENAIVKGDLDVMPYDLESGYDFRINKTKQGDYADYSSSTFARKSTPVPASALEHLKLHDIKAYRFGKVEMEAMEAMVEAHLTGRSYADAAPVDGGVQTGNPVLDAKMNAVPAAAVAAEVAASPSPAVGVLSAAPSDAPTVKPSAADVLARLKAKAAGQ
jgi:hypothetical protein